MNQHITRSQTEFAESHFRNSTTQQLNPIFEFALPLISSHGGDYYACGTAAVIAPYLAVTAQHVVDDHHRHWNNARLPHQQADLDFKLLAIQQGEAPAPRWQITKAWCCNYTDIVFLRLLPANPLAAQHKWISLALDLIPPAIGTPIAAFGYRASGIVEPLQDNDREPVLQHIPTTSTGIVEEVHDLLRDSTMPFPCFRTNARFDGGMSGGPVINNTTGRLCGIICSSIPSVLEGDPHSSFVTSIWAAMGCLITLGNDVVSDVEPYPALELAQRRIISAHGLDRIEVSRNPQSGQVILQLRYPDRL